MIDLLTYLLTYSWSSHPHALAIGLDLAVKSTLLILLAMFAAASVGRGRILLRTAMWNACLLGLLVLPATSIGLPRLRIAVLPAASNAPAEAAPVEPSALAGTSAESVSLDANSMALAAQMEAASVKPVVAATAVETAGFDAKRTSPSNRSAATQVDADSQGIDWLVAGILVYAAGGLVLAVRLVCSLVAVRRLRRSGQPITDSAWVETFASWTRRLEIAWPVRLLHSPEVSVPVAFGWYSPAVMIPSGMVAAAGCGLRDSVLLHELAHIRRCDYGWQLLLRAVQIIYWPNPLIWLIARPISAAREDASDALCVHHAADPREYRLTLLEVARSLVRRPVAALGIAMARSSKIARRLEQIDRGLRVSRCLAGRPVRSALAVGAILIAGVVGACQLATRENATSGTSPSSERKAPSAPDAQSAEQTGTRFPRDSEVRIEELGFVYAGLDVLSVFNHADPHPYYRNGLQMHIKMRYPNQVNRVDGYEVRILDRTDDDVRAAVRKIDSTEKRGYGIYFALKPGDAIHLDGGVVKATGISSQPDAATGQRTVSFESVTPQGAEKFSLSPVTLRDLGYCTLWIRHGVDERGFALEILDSPSQRKAGAYPSARCGGPPAPTGSPMERSAPPGPGATNEQPPTTQPTRMRYFILLIVGKDRMTFEGQDATWDQVREKLAALPNLKQTVFTIAVDNPDVPVGRFHEAMSKAHQLVNEFGMEYVSDVGVKPLGSKADPPQEVSAEPSARRRAEATTRATIVTGGSALIAQDLRVRLKSGAEVELLGIRALADGNAWWAQKWWGLDGQPLKEDPWDPDEPAFSPEHLKHPAFQHYAEQLKKLREYQFAARMTGPQGAIESPEHPLVYVWHVEEAPFTTGRDLRRGGRNVPGGRTMHAAIPADRTTTNFRIGIGTGQWETRAVSHGEMSSSSKDGIDVTFSGATDNEGAATIFITDRERDRALRVLAIDHNGQIHVATCDHTSGMGDARMTEAKFPGLAPKQIKEYQFQTMAYDWATFKDIPLRPGLKSFKSATLEAPPTPASRPAAGVDRPETGESRLAVQPGAVIERTINADAVGHDCVIDFDSGILLSPPGPGAGKVTDAFKEKGIDAACTTEKAGPGLYGFDMVVAPVAAEAWDAWNKEPYRSLVHHVQHGTPGTPAVMSAAGQLPATYLFKTREGGVGVLQILELRNEPDPRFIRIRYRMLTESTGPAARATISQPANP